MTNRSTLTLPVCGLDFGGHLKTVNQIAGEYSVHPNQVSTWKKQLLDAGPDVFDSHAERDLQEHVARETELYEQIGRLKMELEWLKKKASQFN